MEPKRKFPMLDVAIIYWSLFSSCVVVIFNGVCLYTKVQISLREHKVLGIGEASYIVQNFGGTNLGRTSFWLSTSKATGKEDPCFLYLVILCAVLYRQVLKLLLMWKVISRESSHGKWDLKTKRRSRNNSPLKFKTCLLMGYQKNTMWYLRLELQPLYLLAP